MRRRRRARRLGRELLDGAAVEDLALDGAAADDVALVGSQAGRAEPASSAWIVGGTTSSSPPSSRRHREHLLEEQRVAVGRGDDAAANVGVDLAAFGELVDEQLAVARRERLEQDRGRIELAAAPAWAQLEQLRARDAEEEDRARRATSRRRARSRSRKSSALPTGCRRARRPAGRSAAARLPAASGTASCVSDAATLADHCRPGSGTDAASEDLDQRPVGDVLAVGEAARAQHVGRVADVRDELGHEARLADAGGPEQREQMARALRDGVLEVAGEARQLSLAPDERRVEPARDGVGTKDRLTRAGRRRTGSRLPFSSSGSSCFDDDRVPYESEGRSPDQDLARARRPARGGPRR